MGENTRAQLAQEVKSLRETVTKSLDVQATHSAQLLPLITQRTQVDEAISRSLEACSKLKDMENIKKTYEEVLNDVQETMATHGSQILRLIDLGIEKWPDIREDVVRIKSESHALQNDVLHLKKEVVDLRETSTRTWRELAGLHQDTAQFASFTRANPQLSGHAGGGAKGTNSVPLGSDNGNKGIGRASKSRQNSVAH
jgi:predicted nuclease with TOPRIM domain